MLRKHSHLGSLRSQQTLLASLAQNHICRQVSSAHRSRCSLIQHSWQTLLALFTQNHTRRQASYAHRSRCSLIQRSTKAPATLAHSSALFALQERHLVGDQGATWWQGSHDLPRPPTQVSAKSAHKQLRKSTFYTLAAPPGGRSGRHLVAR